MSKHADFDSLAEELQALHEAGGVSAEAVVVARLLHGFSLEDWRAFRRRYPAEHWCALPVQNMALSGQRQDRRAPKSRTAKARHVPVRQLTNILTDGLVAAQIDRELLRLKRTGGDLCVLAATPCNSEALARQSGNIGGELERLLHSCLLSLAEECDSAGNLGDSCHVLLLPGVSRLRARLMAEELQRSFTAQAATIASARTGEATLSCAVGVVCITSAETMAGPSALDKAIQALNTALAQKQGHIFLAENTALEDHASLVHSKEKRFLFFGGQH